MQQKNAQLLLKSVDEEQRIITGIASTGMVDRDGDIVEPSGAQYTLPIPLLWQHDREKPIGEVTDVNIINGQILITAKIAKVESEGKLKERLDEAWESIKTGLVKGLSIGFKRIAYSYLENGVHYQKWEWRELSVVTIPANASAGIQSFKAADDADGQQFNPSTQTAETPSVSDSLNHDKPPEPETPPDNTIDLPKPAAPEKAAFSLSNESPNGQKVNVKMTLQEQIQAAREAAKTKQAQLIAKEAEKLQEGANIAEIEQNCVAMQADIDAIEKQVERLVKIQAAQNDETVTKAAAIPDTPVFAGGTAPAIVKAENLPNLDAGIGFAQYVRALMLSQHEARKNSNFISPIDAAKALGYSAPVVDFITKATLGTTTDTGFAKPLVETQTYKQDFLELLRKATVFDKIQGFRNVPFNIKINGQASGGVASWVGEGQKKPVTNPTFNSIEIKEHKLAAIVVYTQELLRRADPAIDALVRDDLIAACATQVDETFLSTVNGNDVRPAGILHGATRFTKTGVLPAQYEADLQKLMGEFIKNNLSADGAVFLMSETRAMQMSLLRDPLGNSYFNGMSLTGAKSLMGIPVITSEAVGNNIILLKPQEILTAQDGGVDIAYSDQANITDGGTVHNLWQENKFAIRAEKFITWAKRRPMASVYVNYD